MSRAEGPRGWLKRLVPIQEIAHIEQLWLIFTRGTLVGKQVFCNISSDLFVQWEPLRFSDFILKKMYEVGAAGRSWLM